MNGATTEKGCARLWGSALLGLGLALALASTAAESFEIRSADETQGGVVTVAGGELVDDSLIALARAVVVEGEVHGDLIAFARQVVVRGTVTGNVYTAAETVSIEGSVAGSVLGFGRELEARNGRVERSLYGFGQRVLIGRDAWIGGDAALFGETLRMVGSVGRDVLGFGQELEVGGQVGRNTGFFGQEVRIMPGARIGGDVTLHVPSENNAHVADGAEIGGEVMTELSAVSERPSRYLRPGFYGFVLLRLAAAFVVGLVLLGLVPGLAAVPRGGARELVTTGALGLAAIVMTPIVIVLVGLTLIGLPLAVFALFAWIMALYLAKIVVAGEVGQYLLGRPDAASRRALALGLGLVLVFVAVSLPWFGPVAQFVLTSFGVGVLLQFAWRAASRRTANAPA